MMPIPQYKTGFTPFIISKNNFFSFSVNSTGLIRPHGEQLAELSKLSTRAPTSVDRISDFFVGVNNTEIFAHVGTTAHFDCLVARPNLDEHGPVSIRQNLFGNDKFHKIIFRAAAERRN